MQVCLIESTTPAELVSQVVKQPRKTPADVVAGSESSSVPPLGHEPHQSLTVSSSAHPQ